MPEQLTIFNITGPGIGPSSFELLSDLAAIVITALNKDKPAQSKASSA